jgi:hypothetical protein
MQDVFFLDWSLFAGLYHASCLCAFDINSGQFSISVLSDQHEMLIRERVDRSIVAAALFLQFGLVEDFRRRWSF